MMEKEVAFRDNVTAKENLPLSFVYYPGFYGAFFSFSLTRNSQKYFCTCAFEAINNYTKLRLLEPIHENVNPSRNFILDSMYFPISVINELISDNTPQNENIINYLSFKNKICHECNNVIPSKKYCVPMYGGSFKQNFGWYINKQGFEWGIAPISNQFIQEICPQEILDRMELDPNTVRTEYEKLVENDVVKARHLMSQLQKQNRKMWRIVENEVRLKFGHKKIGDAWTSETILYHIVKSIFPNFTVYRHYRPSFLNGLELDIFIEDLNIGIEYQGIQHYKPVKHWGGKEALEKLKERDIKKKRIMLEQNIPLIYYKYDEDLSDNLVMLKMKDYL